MMPIPPSFSLGIGCSDPTSGQVVAATLTTVTQIVDVPATPLETDVWDNQCAGYEARVPPGALPPDGVDAATATGSIGTVSTIDKCYRTASVCSEPGTAPHIINDHPVTRACWQWSNTFDCVTADASSDCNQPRFGQCAASGVPVCVEWDTIIQPPFCSHVRQDFQCQTADPVTQTVQNCGTQAFCEGGHLLGHEPPARCGFRALGHPISKPGAKPASTWTRASCRCSRVLTIRATRSSSAWSIAAIAAAPRRSGLFTDLSMAMNAVSTVGKAAFSNYTYDALFASDAPHFVLAGFESLLGTGFDSGLAGILAGDLSVADFVMSLVPSVLDASPCWRSSTPGS